jgi:hypothetical protein
LLHFPVVAGDPYRLSDALPANNDDEQFLPMESDESESIQERKMPLEEESSLNCSLKASMNAMLQTVDKSARQTVKEPLEIVARCCRLELVILVELYFIVL